MPARVCSWVCSYNSWRPAFIRPFGTAIGPDVSPPSGGCKNQHGHPHPSPLKSAVKNECKEEWLHDLTGHETMRRAGNEAFSSPPKKAAAPYAAFLGALGAAARLRGAALLFAFGAGLISARAVVSSLIHNPSGCQSLASAVRT